METGEHGELGVIAQSPVTEVYKIELEVAMIHFLSMEGPVVLET